MYVHIGKDTIIFLKDIITILDLEKLLLEKDIKQILEELKIEKNIIDISDGNNKSLIMIQKGDKIIGYISNISSNTLQKRIQKEII